MDDKVIDFSQRKPVNAFSKLEKDSVGLGFNVVPHSVVEEISHYLRAKGDPGYTTFVVRTEGENKTIAHAHLVDKAGLTEGMHLLECERFALESLPKLVRGADIRVVRGSDGHSAVYALGERGTYGVSYYDGANSSKGAMMAALLLYAFSMINMFIDERLFTNVFSYLPFVPEIGLDFMFYEIVEGIINETV